MAHIMHVAIHGIDARTLEGLGYVGQHLVGRVEIVAIEHTHHIARSHCDAFVHGVIDSLVRLADPAHLSVEPTFVLLDDLERLVG